MTMYTYAKRIFLVAAIMLAGGTGPVRAAIRLPSVIGHNMVLQRDMPVPLWGWADPGEEVTIRIGERTAKTRAGANGKWRLVLKPMPAGGPFKMIVEGKTRTVLQNVLVGEVWICSGQSNAAMALQSCADSESEIAGADFPRIRLFSVAKNSSCRSPGDVQGLWVECSPRTAPSFSGLAYLFGRYMHKHLDVPIGMISSSVGGTEAEYWTPYTAFYGEPEIRHIITDWNDSMLARVDRMAAVQRDLETWKRNAIAAREVGSPLLMPPVHSSGDPRYVAPGRLFNAMIHPLIPYAMRGVIWYQGEANVSAGREYRTLFASLIRAWRQEWGQGEFPFLFVQLPNFTPARDDPVMSSGWAELREAQAMALSLPATGMAVAIDVGDADNIHPKDKQAVARRLGLAARAVAYGEKIVHSGPIYKGMTVSGNKVSLTFDHVGSGLVARGGELRRFGIAGPDARFVWAKAVIEGDKVIAWSDEVEKPVAVRYAWSSNPEGCNLYNKEGLPASPFRTSDKVDMPLPRTTHIARCPRMEEAPTIDGKLEADEWKAARALGPFRIIESYSYSRYPTETRIAYDEQNLYVVFRCAEMDLDDLACGAGSRDGAVWDDDSVEIFLDTDLDGTTYYQYAVNANGVIFDTKNRWGSNWNGPCTVATGREKEAWIVEMAIPWKTLEMPAPGPRAQVGLQLARTRPQAPIEWSQWAPTQGPTNHRPSHFGLLMFE
ncbi:MAG: sialate O-acetylesterase [Lentisphaerae bacterium]|nr:sialate O-acetylesterase [Lentisphaerota bacterium]